MRHPRTRTLQLYSEAWSLPGLPQGARLVLLAWVEHADDRAEAWPSAARLASLTDMSERRVRGWLRWLEGASSKGYPEPTEPVLVRVRRVRGSWCRRFVTRSIQPGDDEGHPVDSAGWAGCTRSIQPGATRSIQPHPADSAKATRLIQPSDVSLREEREEEERARAHTRSIQPGGLHPYAVGWLERTIPPPEPEPDDAPEWVEAERRAWRAEVATLLTHPQALRSLRAHLDALGVIGPMQPRQLRPTLEAAVAAALEIPRE